ncbi:mannose-1-phosphate guanylyltransferase [Elysia marginata]|uniref:Mannose-1-phosphate guanylyltransferase n=1 Tax=Elysia marginata TaxID=1093978 RepID=A0AAV4FQQ1_9GAST|nr:mannose-1-phosphate guanylyltransferase [Elysia marginata]
MAGGIGSRFWPASTDEYPKQFHDFLGCGKSMLQDAFYRLSAFIPKENIFVLTNSSYRNLIEEQLPQIGGNQIVYEPALRNTAPCILYAMLKIHQLNPNAVIVVSPSDSWIENKEAYKKDVLGCLTFCETSSSIATIGIKPIFPSTGYGYIKYLPSDDCMKKVEQFTEKPEEHTAKKYFSQEGFFWNSGIFIWNTSTILSAYKKIQPEMYNILKYDRYNTQDEEDFIKENYPKTENISIDYAILEYSKNIYVRESSFGWNDLGTWGALYKELPKDAGNNAVVNAIPLLKNTKNSIVLTDSKKTVVVDGLDDYIIVDTKHTLFIYPKGKGQSIKLIRNEVQELLKNRDSLK